MRNVRRIMADTKEHPSSSSSSKVRPQRSVGRKASNDCLLLATVATADHSPSVFVPRRQSKKPQLETSDRLTAIPTTIALALLLSRCSSSYLLTVRVLYWNEYTWRSCLLSSSLGRSSEASSSLVLRSLAAGFSGRAMSLASYCSCSERSACSVLSFRSWVVLAKLSLAALSPINADLIVLKHYDISNATVVVDHPTTTTQQQPARGKKAEKIVASTQHI